MNRKYIELSKNKNMKVFPIKTPDGNAFRIEELLMLGDRPIFLYFVADRFGKSLSNVFNTYFGNECKDIFNNLGWIEYKIQLLNRIQKDLIEKKQSFTLENKEWVR